MNYTDPGGESPYPPPSLNPCIDSSELDQVKHIVRVAICNMIAELEDENLLEDIPDQRHVAEAFRTKEEAHILSTAHHIINDFVTIDDLRASPVDMDKNVWYRPEWDYFYCAGPSGRLILNMLVKLNALSKVPSDYRTTRFKIPHNTPYALEGYASWDPHRLPNIANPNVSKHTIGEAFDISEDGRTNPAQWEQLNGRIDDIAKSNDLYRAYFNRYIAYADYTAMEWWHFEYTGFGR